MLGFFLDRVDFSGERHARRSSVSEACADMGIPLLDKEDDYPQLSAHWFLSTTGEEGMR